MNYLNKGLVSLFLIFLTFGLVAVSFSVLRSSVKEGADRPSFRGSQERTYAVPVAKFTSTNFLPKISSYGEVASWNSLELRSSVGGRIDFVSQNFRDGAVVNKGELLYVIDPVEFQNDLDFAKIGLEELQAERESAEANLILAESELKSAEKQLRLRQDNFNRQVELSENEIVTKSVVENAELNVAIAEQTLLSRESALSQASARKKISEIAYQKQLLVVQKAERQLKETEFYAPFNAIISKVSALKGRLITVGERLGTLIDPLALEVSFQVSNADFDKIIDENLSLVGLPVSVSLEFENRDVRINGKITRMASEVMEGAAGKKIFASLETSSNTILRPGDFVKVIIKEKELTSVFVVPASSVDPNNKVLVLNDEGRLDELEVKLVRRQGDELVLKNVPEGVEYVIRRTPQLGADLRIDPIRKEDLNKAIDSTGKIKKVEEEFIELDEEKRQFYIERIKKNKWMPDTAKDRILKTLEKEKVPKKLIDRLEQRMKGS